MRCETCSGTGRKKRSVKEIMQLMEVVYDTRTIIVEWPCPDCIGGIASCCDVAGANYSSKSKESDDK